MIAVIEPTDSTENPVLFNREKKAKKMPKFSFPSAGIYWTPDMKCYFEVIVVRYWFFGGRFERSARACFGRNALLALVLAPALSANSVTLIIGKAR